MTIDPHVFANVLATQAGYIGGEHSSSEFLNFVKNQQELAVGNGFAANLGPKPGGMRR